MTLQPLRRLPMLRPPLRLQVDRRMEATETTEALVTLMGLLPSATALKRTMLLY